MRPRILIFTVFKDKSSFLRRVDHRTMVWGLDELGIEWDLHHPWHPLPDLSQYALVYVSLYSGSYNNFFFHSRKAEVLCRDAGLPVVNSAEQANPGHSHYLKVWKEAGIGCPKYQNFLDFDAVTLPFPMILRSDGIHRGINMCFAQSREEARRQLTRHPADLEPLDVAIEFVDTRGDAETYEKFRAYVVGDRVIPAHYLRSKSRFVNFKDSLLDPATCARDRRYINEDDDIDRATILKAARLTGFEVLALDYAIKPNGAYVFWEGNRFRATAGDDRMKWMGLRPPDMIYGTVLAQFLYNTATQGAALKEAV